MLVNQAVINVLPNLPVSCFQSATSVLHCTALHLNPFHLWHLYYDPRLPLPSLPLLRLYLSHCLYVCLPRSLGNGPRALCAAMNDSSPSVAYVLGLENKRGGRRLAGCLQGWVGGEEGDRGDMVARGGGLQQAPQRSTSGKNMTKRVFFNV